MGGRRRATDALIDLAPEWLPSWALFTASCTQWRRAGDWGAATGLDYAAVAVVARGLAIRLDGERLADLQAMESACLKIWADERARQLKALERRHG